MPHRDTDYQPADTKTCQTNITSRSASGVKNTEGR